MARTNYKSEKRQKELARGKKKEEKRLRKLEKNIDNPEAAPGPAEGEPEQTQTGTSVN